MVGWRQAALDRLRPTRQQDERIRAAAASLEAEVGRALEARGWEGRPRIEGSVAKDTYLRGQADADVFVAFPPTLPREALEARTRALAELLDDPVIAYAEHPYAQGTWESLPAEIVPCYEVDHPSKLLSAVDRTPFHTEYVLANLPAEARDEVRLLKAWLSTVGAYGAEEQVLGFSGYLCELLVLVLGSFEDVLRWAIEGFPHPIAVEAEAQASFEDPLIVVDPVDPERNVAAAVSRRTLERVREAASAFRAEPRSAFFEPHPPATMDQAQGEHLCHLRGSRVLAWSVAVGEDVLEDPLFAQLRRAVRIAGDGLEREQVPVTSSAVHLEADATGRVARAWGLIEADGAALERPLHHAGPPANVERHAERFRERWEGAEEAESPVMEQEGRLVVLRRRTETTLAAISQPLLEKANAGKVVDQALTNGTFQLLEGEEALAAMPAEARSALLDRRRPWERW